MVFNIYVNGDDKAIEAIDEARKAKKMDVFNKLLGERRAKLSKAIPYAEKIYSLNPKDLRNCIFIKRFISNFT